MRFEAAAEGAKPFVSRQPNDFRGRVVRRQRQRPIGVSWQRGRGGTEGRDEMERHFRNVDALNPADRPGGILATVSSAARNGRPKRLHRARLVADRRRQEEPDHQQH